MNPTTPPALPPLACVVFALEAQSPPPPPPPTTYPIILFVPGVGM